MNAVIYHAQGQPLWDAKPDAYEKLFEGFKKNVAGYVDEVIHLTLPHCPQWGTDNWVSLAPLDPKDIMYNREVCFTGFLKWGAEDDIVYWFTEPDARIVEAFPPLGDDVDLALLWRADTVPITPSFRLARTAALPVFEWVLAHFDLTKKDWHGDSAAFNALYEAMGKPELGTCFTWNNVRIELRDYRDYTRRDGRYVRHWKAGSKARLLAEERL